MLIGGSLLLVPKFGASFMTKFFWLTAAGTWATHAAFSPASTGLTTRPLRAPLNIPAWDCDALDGSYTMGAECFAGALIYLWLAHRRLWYVAAPLLLFDFTTYGWARFGGFATGILAGITLL